MINMGKLRFGVIGAAGGQAGGWAQKIMDWGKTEVFDIELVAVCDIRKTGVENVAKKHGVTAYTDYEKMYKEAKLDAVVIGTPHYVHAPMSILAAEHEINILVEKPMCINLKQADEMRKAVKINDVKLAVGFQHRFSPAYLGLKNAVESGDLGQIFQFNMFFRHWRTEMYYETSTPVKDPVSGREHGWRGHWRTEGAGALSNQLIHFLDQYQWIAPSPVKSVTAISRVSKHSFPETDDNTNAIVEFMDGSMGNIQAGVAYEYGNDSEFGLYGTNGALIHRKNMFDEKGEKVPYLDMRPPAMQKKKPAKSYMPGVLNGSMQMFAGFLEAIEEDDSSLISCDVDEGRKSIELMRGILLSIIFEKKVSFPVHDSESLFPSLAHTYKDPMFE
jgi:UDP-N-acetyl-2-amino-2-deoxyglucuronate dehydrogenase